MLDNGRIRVIIKSQDVPDFERVRAFMNKYDIIPTKTDRVNAGLRKTASRPERGKT